MHLRLLLVILMKFPIYLSKWGVDKEAADKAALKISTICGLRMDAEKLRQIKESGKGKSKSC